MSTDRRMKWDRRYLRSARDVAEERSKDTTKVGAVLVSPHGAEILNAFNGPPQGVEDHQDRFVRPAKYLFASHAEQNLIAFAARHGIRTDGCSVVVTHFPCASCARSLIQEGIVQVGYGNGTTAMPVEEFSAAATMFREAGVVCEAVEAF